MSKGYNNISNKMVANTIDEVIDILGDIIESSKKDESTIGYFAALYQKVTISVKDKLHTNYFDDDERMERLDVLFANRYLLAYYNYKQGKSITKSWGMAFQSSNNNGLIVLQHLLLGMNAHINLDLGIAASEISDRSSMDTLHSDFNKINEILGALVDEIQNDLSKIWPTLIKILKLANKVDDFFINFSMSIARDGAWKFANELVVEKEKNSKAHLITLRDDKISKFATSITVHKIMVRIIFFIVRIGERGKPSDKIKALERVIKNQTK
ncbi:DUF5995 family protein [Hwangdonia lutea]|uniref:DUF5995 family protein n=1 Tax=Hwangdonia lutea TaxID=3075823 RepID=A0AA97HQ16_9FLAO|nr:DUF5995 family protein [Hwangdonia sp. SCSIO 19198]WOD42193.1 DUF5995 family protein [Hwangdonia sp. SCSIO 19198]